MNQTIKLAFVILASTLFGLSLGIGSNVFANRDKDKELPLKQLKAFTDVYGHIKENYVDDIDEAKLLESAISGMLSGLDPHSSYLNADEYNELRIGTTGEFGGLGIEVTMEDGFIKVIAPMDDTPAKRAGVQSGDLIIRIDEKPVKGMSLNESIKQIRGKPGTDILLTIVREGLDGPIKLSVTRDIIQVKSVKGEMINDVYGYIRITNFQTHTTEDLIKTIDKLTQTRGQALAGIILDLRDNPGGILEAAVGVSDAFLEDGIIVSHEGRNQGSSKKYYAKPGDLLNDAPIVVLVNDGTASASEIVAGALQDHVRAVTLGTKTFGKGSVQTVQELNNGAAIKMTTARYFTPNGRSIQAEGIEPDILVDPLKFHRVKQDHTPVKESDLNGHLDNPNAAQAKQSKTDNQPADDPSQLAEKDYQLFEALNLLKALTILDVSSK